MIVFQSLKIVLPLIPTFKINLGIFCPECGHRKWKARNRDHRRERISNNENAMALIFQVDKLSVKPKVIPFESFSKSSYHFSIKV